MLAQFAYVRSHYAKSLDLSEEKNTSVHRKDIVNSFDGVAGTLTTVMGTMLGQQHDQDIDYLKNYGLLKSMLTNQNVDSLDKIPTAYLLYQLNKDLLEKYADLLEKYNQLNSNLTPSGITDVSHAINTAYGSGNISYHVVGKVCFVYFVFTPSQKCDNVGLLNDGVLPLAKDALYRSISTWGNPNVAVSLVQTVTTGGLRFWCGESSIGMQIFDSFSYCIK